MKNSQQMALPLNPGFPWELMELGQFQRQPTQTLSCPEQEETVLASRADL